MPRTARLVFPNAALHITARGNNCQDLFLRDEDKHRYLSLLRSLKEENDISIFHYCIMTNHIHLIAWLNAKSSLAKFMKQLNLSYFAYFKKAYSYFGHLWQGRFKSNIIDTDSYLLQCGKYIELNPVRAGMVSLPQQYAFSSYRYYAQGSSDPIVTPSPAYLSLSNLPEARRKHYLEFTVNESIINTDRLDRLKFIGSDVFVNKLREYYGIRNENRKRGRPRKAEK
jgi:putative transposase